MKTATLLLLVCILGVSFADQSQFRATLTNLVNLQAKAGDAVESALNLLKDLRNVNTQSQERADAQNRTDEDYYAKLIADLTLITEQNKKAADDATTYRKQIESEIQATEEHLARIVKRRADIVKTRDEFREHRCYSSLMFVKQLKEHDEALSVIRWLRQDVLGVVGGNAGTQAGLSQIQDSVTKLGAYTHLFNQAAMNDFAQLSQGRQDVDAETAQWDARADDNTQDKLALQSQQANTASRDVGNKLLEAIDRLEKHLIASEEDLKQSEIKAAWDLVRWLQATEAELKQLADDEETQTNHLDRLQVTLVGAKAREDSAWATYYDSVATLNDAIAARDSKRAWYAQETARRQEENSILDDIIRIFVQKVNVIDSGLKSKVEDYNADQKFDNAALDRQINPHVARDAGKVYQNVESESRAMFL